MGLSTLVEEEYNSGWLESKPRVSDSNIAYFVFVSESFGEIQRKSIENHKLHIKTGFTYRQEMWVFER